MCPAAYYLRIPFRCMDRLTTPREVSTGEGLLDERIPAPYLATVYINLSRGRHAKVGSLVTSGMPREWCRHQHESRG